MRDGTDETTPTARPAPNAPAARTATPPKIAPPATPPPTARTVPTGRPVEIFAHACTLEGYQPNRIASFRACIDAGLACMEVDVRLSDGELVLGHDVPVAPDRLDAAARLLDRVGECTWLMLDLKDPAAAIPAADLVSAAGLANVVFASTSGRDLRAVRSRLPAARISLSFPQDVPRVSQDPRMTRVVSAFLLGSRVVLPLLLLYWTARYRPSQFTLHWRTTSRLAFAVARRLRRPIYVWTVDDPALASRLLHAGAAGVITNRPLAVRSFLNGGSATGGSGG